MRTGVSRSFLSQATSADRSKSASLPQHAAPPDAFIDDTPRRSPPSKAASFSLLSRQENKASVLPDRSPEAERLSQQSISPNNYVKTSYRAAECGNSNLLPINDSTGYTSYASSKKNGFSTRIRSSSSNSFAHRRNNTTPTEQLQLMTQSLRSRRRNAGTPWGGNSDDEGGPGLPTFATPPPPPEAPSSMDHYYPHHHRERWARPTWSDTYGKFDKPARKRDFVLCLARSTMNIKRANVFQALVTFLVTFFVWDSYQKALATTEQLLIVKHEESMMMLHLKRLEEQSLNLHESIARLSEGNVAVHSQGNEKVEGGSESFDGEIIKIQTKQLREMEDELDHEVKTLQTKIQHSDREHIVRLFGEGPVQVVLDVLFPQQHQEPNKISILLWYDTPHAAWTFIEQLDKGLWNDSAFALDKNVAITVEPPHAETLKKIDFVEKGQKRHEAWTVGLTESPQGGMTLFINLQDNTQYHKHDVCIGKVIDGFDTLQRLTRLARGNEVVTLRKATASHLARRESAGLA